MADGTLIFDTKLDTNGLTTGLGKVGDVAGAAFKGAAVAVGAAATAVGALTKSALDGYASFEQLEGGVKTLFGESANEIMQYAENAYQTAGLSANQYMETVTSFSASLIQSLDGDTAEAARVADVAITDMSDNANKMGTSIDMIQNAYNGFAKGNFTMLDNLKLGYGGTKEEMQRLLSDAEKLPAAMGREFDLNNYADVVEAIHLVQDEMGIAGATAAEASTTIEGSVNSMKAAWQNLVVGIADDNADLDKLITQFVDSVKTAGENILPRVEIILNGVGELVQSMLPVIMGMLPGIITGVLPKLLDAGVAMINSLITGITENLSSLVALALDIVTQLVGVIIDNLPVVVEAGLQIIVQLALGIASALPTLIPTLVDTVLLIVDTLIDNVDILLDAALAIIIALAEGLIIALPKLIVKVPIIITSLLNALLNYMIRLSEAGVKATETIRDSITKSWSKVTGKVSEWIGGLKDRFTSAVASFTSIGTNIAQGIWQGMSNSLTWIKNKISQWVGNVFDFCKKILGIASPSKKFKWIGEMCVAGFDEGFEEFTNGDAITRGINASVRTIGANTSSANGTLGGFNQTINFHNETSTPDELARKIRLESKYGLMQGVAFAHG